MTREPPPRDPLERLAGALRKDAPAPDPQARRKALTAAMEKFDELHQGTAAPARPSHVRPQKGAGFLTGVRNMLSNLTSKPVLAATTSVAALCLGLFIILPQQQGPQSPVAVPTPPPVQPSAETVAEAPVPVPAPGPAQPLAEEAEAFVQNNADTAAGSAKKASDADTPQPAPVTSERLRNALPSEMATSPRQIRPYNGMPPEVAGVLHGGGASMINIAPPQPLANTESYANADANPVKVTASDPVSTFSADVDTASYSVVRSDLMRGILPPADAVRIEEMVNYFPYDYPAPDADDAPFRVSVNTMQTPWNPGTKLVRIGLQGRMPAIADRPPLNLVLLIDTSGSMQAPAKLPLLKQSLRLMLGQLRPEDQIAIVTYAGSAGEVLAPTPASDSAAILSALDRLEAGGSTAGAQGLELAYRTAEKMAGDGEVSRILLATDGDFNVGISDPEALTDFIAAKRDQGSYLSVLGFGRGNLDDATMQALAQNGNGQAAYIDTLQEARKVLVDQLSGALFPIAGDVKLQVEWNPASVAEYRLIGYETRALKREDFNNDKVDAGEIGAGHTVTALYEVTPPDSPARLNDPLRYGNADSGAQAGDELGFLRLRYKDPGAAGSRLIETPIMDGDGTGDTDARFAAAIAGFGQLLTGGTYLGDWGWADAIALAEGSRGEDPFGYRIEAINLMRLAVSLSGTR